MKKIYKGWTDETGKTEGFLFDKISDEAKKAGIESLPDEVVLIGLHSANFTLYDKSTQKAFLVKFVFNKMEKYVTDQKEIDHIINGRKDEEEWLNEVWDNECQDNSDSLNIKHSSAKMDMTTRIYKEVLGIDQNHRNINKYVKAVIFEHADRGDIIVKNDNFGTRRKYADFTNGKIEAGLHPLQIVFSGVDVAHICHERYINEKDEVCYF